MDIRKFFSKRVVQSAPTAVLDVGKPPASQSVEAGSIARTQYAKKSPFFEKKSSPPKRVLTDDSSNGQGDQTPPLKKPKVVKDFSESENIQSNDDVGIGTLRLGSCPPQAPSTTSTHGQLPAHPGFSMASAQLRSIQGGLASCSQKPTSETNVKPNPSKCAPHPKRSELWTVKHKPRCSADLVGNQQMVYRLREWLSKWESNFSCRPQFGSTSKLKGKINEEPRKAVLLSGPPGIGKTSTALIISKELGFQILEVNASDARGKADADVKHGMVGRTSNIIKELVTNQCVTIDMSAPHKKMVLLMDEVDGMSGGDRGGVQDLIKSIQKSKIPIICICNDKYDRKIQSLLNHCMELNFQKPAKNEVLRRLSNIAKAECLQLNDTSLEILLESVNYDIRLALNQLQYRSHGGKFLEDTEMQRQAGAGMKDVAMTPFMAADRLLARGRDISLSEQIDLVFQDADLVPLIIQENYLNFAPAGERRDDVRLSLLAQAADSLSVGDIVNRSVRQHQRWDLMPFACVESAVKCSALVRGVRQPLFAGERNFNRFAGWLGKNSTAGKNSRLLSDVQLHLLVSGNCPASRNALRLDYMQEFRRSLVAPLQEKDKAGVGDVIKFMEEYSLTREDRDAILEIAQVKGFNSMLDSIPAQVKATFTRVFNQKSGERVIRSSVMLPDVKAKKMQVSALPTLLLNTAIDGVVADEGTDMLDEDLIEADDTNAVIPGVTRTATRQQNGGRTNSKRDAPSTSRSRGSGTNKRGRGR